MAKHYLAYLTANDDGSYIKDMLNFTNMARFSPGVDHINLVIAISAVRPFTDSDMKRIKDLLQLFENCSWISVSKVILKGNVGRDFSSAYVCLKEIAKTAAGRDVVMVKNRSGYGPLCPGWYDAYASLLGSREDLGLVGSTINFHGHPKKNQSGINTHVQTYVYMSYWKYFSEILDNFPAIRCTDRLELIVEGEIGLSRMFMDRNLALSCLAWPDHSFTLAHPTNPQLPAGDIKRKVRNVPVRYKFRAYGRWCLYLKIKWFFKINFLHNKNINEDALLEHIDSFA